MPLFGSQGSSSNMWKRDVFVREQKMDLSNFLGALKERKQSEKNKAMPDVGAIAGIDFDPEGVG